MCRSLALLLVAGCGDSASPTPPDSPPAPVTLLGVLVETGPVMENYVWHSSYTSCGTCEELTVIAFAPDHYDLQIFTREPGQQAAPHCSARFGLLELGAAGFDPLDRTELQLSIGANDCGFTSVGPTDKWVVGVTSRDGGQPTSLAWWPATNPSAVATFPGYVDATGNGLAAAPLIPCAGAPTTLCEPTCDLGAVPTGGCGFAAPTE